jgi:hypothetical protein
VLPGDAGSGATPASEAKAASDRTRPRCEYAQIKMAAATGPMPGVSWSPGCELFGDELKLPAIGREEFDLLEDSGGQATGLTANNGRGISTSTDPPTSDGSQLTITQRSTSVDAQIAAAHLGDEGVAVGRALVVNQVSSRQKNPQSSLFPL